MSDIAMHAYAHLLHTFLANQADRQPAQLQQGNREEYTAAQVNYNWLTADLEFGESEQA